MVVHCASMNRWFAITHFAFWRYLVWEFFSVFVIFGIIVNPSLLRFTRIGSAYRIGKFSWQAALGGWTGNLQGIRAFLCISECPSVSVGRPYYCILLLASFVFSSSSNPEGFWAIFTYRRSEIVGIMCIEYRLKSILEWLKLALKRNVVQVVRGLYWMSMPQTCKGSLLWILASSW